MNQDESRWINIDNVFFLVKPARDFLALRGLYLSHFARFFWLCCWAIASN